MVEAGAGEAGIHEGSGGLATARLILVALEDADPEGAAERALGPARIIVGGVAREARVLVEDVLYPQRQGSVLAERVTVGDVGRERSRDLGAGRGVGVLTGIVTHRCGGRGQR